MKILSYLIISALKSRTLKNYNNLFQWKVFLKALKIWFLLQSFQEERCLPTDRGKFYEHFATDGGYTYVSCLEKQNSLKNKE
jgi:hypothetical protein